MDVPQTNIAIYFNEVVDFIDQALTAGGKVLVNCEMGMSRSSTCVLAYLMLRHQMSAGEALAKVRQYIFRTSSGFVLICNLHSRSASIDMFDQTQDSSDNLTSSTVS